MEDERVGQNQGCHRGQEHGCDEDDHGRRWRLGAVIRQGSAGDVRAHGPGREGQGQQSTLAG